MILGFLSELYVLPFLNPAILSAVSCVGNTSKLTLNVYPSGKLYVEPRFHVTVLVIESYWAAGRVMSLPSVSFNPSLTIFPSLSVTSYVNVGELPTIPVSGVNGSTIVTFWYVALCLICLMIFANAFFKLVSSLAWKSWPIRLLSLYASLTNWDINVSESSW